MNYTCDCTNVSETVNVKWQLVHFPYFQTFKELINVKSSNYFPWCLVNMSNIHSDARASYRRFPEAFSQSLHLSIYRVKRTHGGDVWLIEDYYLLRPFMLALYSKGGDDCLSMKTITCYNTRSICKALYTKGGDDCHCTCWPFFSW